MEHKVKLLKTKQEILKSGKLEIQVEATYNKENLLALLEFQKATKDEFETYQAIWKPARERWESFSEPYFKELLNLKRINERTRDNALAEIRTNWKECPRCGVSAARYQLYCTDEDCGLNLSIGKD